MLELRKVNFKEISKRIPNDKKISPTCEWLLRSNFINKALGCLALYSQAKKDNKKREANEWLNGTINALHLIGATDFTIKTVESLSRVNENKHGMILYKIIKFLSEHKDRI